jgi:ATP-binding cassette subfamily B protein
MKSLLRLKPYFLRHKRKLIFGFICIFLSNVFGVVSPLLVRKAIDSLMADVTALKLFEYASLVVGFSVLSGLFLFLTRQTVIVNSREIEYDLRNDLFAHMQKLSLRYFQNTPTGDLMAHLTNDIGAVRSFLGPAVMYSVDTTVSFLMIVGIMLSINPLLTLYALIPTPFLSFLVYRLGKVVHDRYKRIQEHYSVLTTRAQETISGIRVIKAYAREAFEIDTFKKLSWEYLQKTMRLVKIESGFWPLMMLIIGISGVIVLWVGGRSYIHGTMTLGSVVAFIFYLGMLTWPLIAFGWVINIIQRASASMDRLNRIFDTEPQIKDSSDTNYTVEQIEGEIEFRGVAFRYGDQNPSVLKNVNLKIDKGMTLAVVGYTGSGKSTLVNLIPRLYDVTSGELLIDGTNIKNIPLQVLRSNIGYVTQETFLFSDSIKENIGFGVDDPLMEEIEEAAIVSQIHGDVMEFPKQFDTVIGERGITLSGGQKQRTSIARALLRKPKILILDDSLSAVDTYTEERILQRLKKVMAERTSIIISHRISAVKDADLIVVLDDGEIAERGTHDELVAIGGIYADLHYKQLLEEELEEM